MKKLLIVESPAKIKTISKFLGPDFRIVATMGHIKDLPKKSIGVTMNGGITLEYVVMDNKDKVIKDIKKEAATASDIYLAPDPDREGEIIAWHVAQEIESVINAKKQHVHRIAFNEITQSAIEDALKHPSIIDENKVAAQQARRVLDRWVGYEVSPILWRKVSKGLSAGRVQSVALKLICMREDELRAFKPEEYWSIIGHFFTDAKNQNAKNKIIATLTHIGKKKAELPNKEAVDKIVADLANKAYVISSIKDSKRARSPYPPFMTSTLQQAAYNQLGFAVQRTMSLAQSLYEGVPLEDKSSPKALITYMRTDSLRIASSALQTARAFIEHEFGDEYLPPKSPVYAKGKAQDAHEAIRPIDVTITPESVKPYLDAALFKLYELIWRRFVACQMKPAQYAQRQVTIDAAPYVFKATGSTLLFDGFLKVYATDEDEGKDDSETSIPATISEQQALTNQKIDPKQHFTQPPPRYTEASLVKEMEKEGIGRPSTYAAILKTIQLRAYTTLDTKKRFAPTELGMAVTKLLDENVPPIMNIAFTAHMEEDLDKVAQGTLNRDELLKTFYSEFSVLLKKFGGEQTERPVEKTAIPCPVCKKQTLVIRFGKAGPFIGCPGFPECTFTSNFERTEDGTVTLVERKGPETLDEKCPKCDKPLVKRMGRFGEFISCSGYPACKYIKQDIANFPCPGCKTGEVIRRSWKGKVFWGCSNYPKCKFSISGDIEQKACPKCKNPYLLKRIDKHGTVTLRCPDTTCGHTEEIAGDQE